MIGLHGSQRESNVLAGLVSLLNDPEQYKAKIDALNAAAEQHRVMMEAAHKERLFAEQAAVEVRKRTEVAEVAESALRQTQVTLDDTMAKITNEGKQLQDAKKAHDDALANHQQQVAEHEERDRQLQERLAEYEAQAQALTEREEAVRQAEYQHVERSRKLRELMG